ncbi:uncharacterized protein J8A68_005311 [[Candida] subhashii]|uniref:Uncharacterized protein n=1 Tax=[Candida] subhashii TaxID=561895 RepID=A0A8J5UTD0_9ASCO|nr:uncharacterized protein J8A68_005311 [[Candida] subhashii]KAG7661175.1 hypothetical protein J8A68_005311 [[Candida] subhashii]
MHAIYELEEFQSLWTLLTDNSHCGHYSSYLNDGIVLSEKEFNLTLIPLPCLLNKLSSGEVTSLETVIAFIKKALLVSDQSSYPLRSTESIKVEQILKAVERANYLDIYYTRYGPIGPLHGLPISKDQLKAMGLEQDEVDQVFTVELGQVMLDFVYYPDLGHSKRMSYNRWNISRRSRSF